MILTVRGVALGGTCALALVGAWLLGLPEVSIVAASGVALVLGAAAWVLVRRPRLALRRTVHPSRLPAGDTCEVRLEVENRARAASPVLALTDRVGSFGTAQLQLAPVAAGARTAAAYSLPNARRGRHHLGPLRWTVADPFGLARRSRELSGTSTVVVTPRTWRLAPLPAAPGDEPDHGTRALTSASTVDEEFASLRDYVTGDDIRRIHWPSTARRGSPVVREFDVPWQRRTTIVADLRTDRHDDRSFERTLSVIASVVELAARRDELVRVATSEDGIATFVPAADHLDELLERLAVARPSARPTTPGRLLAACTGGSGSATGRVVTCVGGLTRSERDELDRQGRRAGLHVVVASAGDRPAMRGAVVVHWDGSRPLDDVWALALGARRTGAWAGMGAGTT